MNKIYKKYIKRVLDIIFSILAIIIVIILFFPIGILILLEDKGSIFYNANRLGKNGKIFKMYKFRTMKVNAPDIRNKDGSTYNGADDPRLTKIGKFLRKTSIDELPQIINVLKGDMSLVGPRPYLTKEIEDMGEHYKNITKIKPGLTGYWQVNGRNDIDFNDRLNMDEYYIENSPCSRSFWWWSIFFSC